MSNKIKYVPAKEEDRAFFIKVHHAAYRETIEKMFGWDEELQDEYANRPFNEGGIHIVFTDDKPVGVVGWENKNEFFWLKELFILPEYQGRGIGSKIVLETIKRAKAVKKDIRLRTLKANLGAKKLYEKYGFRVSDATDIHWNMILSYSEDE